MLITGGATLAGNTDAAALFNPANGMWTPTATMTLTRRLHSATRLPNGQVLVTGTYNESLLR